MSNKGSAEVAGKGGRAKGLLTVLSRNRGLILLTVPTILITVAIAFVSMLFVVMIGEFDLLAGHLSVLPDLVEERSARLQVMEGEYLEDYAIKGDIGALLFDGLTDLGEAERLEQIMSSVSAMDVSLVEPDGTMVATTRTDESFALEQEDVQAVLADEQHITVRFDGHMDEVESKAETGGDDTGSAAADATVSEGRTEQDDVDVDVVTPDPDTFPPVLYAVKLPSGRSLVYEFDYSNYETYTVEQGSWSVTLRDMLLGLDAYAFVYFTEGEDAGHFTAYPISTSLIDEVQGSVTKAFGDDALFVGVLDPRVTEGLDDTRVGVLEIENKSCLAMRAGYPDLGVKVIIAVPLDSFVGGVWHATKAFGVFVALALVLLVVYLKRTRDRELDAGETMTVGMLRKRALGGLFVVIVATVVVFSMFVLLEVMASTASVTKDQRESLQYQIEYDAKLLDQTQKEYIERGVTRNNVLAQLLSSSPHLRNRETLQRLADTVGAQYLMLFDENGEELYSSNAYVGYAIGTDADDPTSVYQRVLMGYPYVVTETAHDDILGTDTHTIASLVTDGEGLPDGILVMCVDDAQINARLADVSLKSTVASYPVQNDQVALVVDDESGKIVGHSDGSKVGEPATNYIDASLLGRAYEGFTFFDGGYAYISEDSSDGMSALLVSFSTMTFLMTVVFGIAAIAAIVLLHSLYYLLATFIVARLEPSGRYEQRDNPLLVFFYGFVAYFFLLWIYAFICVLFKTWPSFGFVFGRQWSQGIHLFSIWGVLFSVCLTLMIVFVAKAVLRHLDETSGLEARTLLRLTNSIVTYGAVLVCGFSVLSMLGVDTATLLASAGIASIAIGMGSKDLITDILAGIFLVSEGTIRVGDIVTVGGWRGRVTDMGVRTCEITNESHDVKIITNSRINEIVNSSRRRTLCSEEIELKRTVDVDEVPALVDAIIASVVDVIPELDQTLRMAEITEITEDSYKVRLTYKCNELERESLTFRLKNTLQLLLEGGTEQLEEDAGIDADAREAGSDANTEPAPAQGDDKPSAPETV